MFVYHVLLLFYNDIFNVLLPRCDNNSPNTGNVDSRERYYCCLLRMDNLLLRMDKFLKQLQNRQLATVKDPCLIVDGKDERKLSHYRGIFFSLLPPCRVKRALGFQITITFLKMHS